MSEITSEQMDRMIGYRMIVGAWTYLCMVRGDTYEARKIISEAEDELLQHVSNECISPTYDYYRDKYIFEEGL